MIPPLARPQRRERRGARRLLREAGDRDPEDLGRADRVEVQLVLVDHEVRGLGEAVEVQREVVRREDLAERDRGGQVRDRRDPAVVDAEAAQRVVDELAERIAAGAGDRRHVAAVARRRDRDVRGAAAEELAERAHLAQRDADLLGVDVHADAAHRDHVERLAHAPASARSGATCSP